MNKGQALLMERGKNVDKYRKKLIEHKRRKRNQYMKLIDWCVCTMLFNNIIFGMLIIYIAMAGPV